MRTQNETILALRDWADDYPSVDIKCDDYTRGYRDGSFVAHNAVKNILAECEEMPAKNKRGRQRTTTAIDIINTIAFIAFGGVVVWFLYQMLPMLVDFN